MKALRLMSIALPALVALAALAGNAQASDTPNAPDAPWKRLSTAGYDLNTPQGAHAFIVRLNGAAIAVCNQEMHNEVIVGTDHSHYYNLCRRETLAAALRKINKPLLTEALIKELPVDAAAMGVTSPSALAAK
jgi:UrcA family protein